MQEPDNFIHILARSFFQICSQSGKLQSSLLYVTQKYFPREMRNEIEQTLQSERVALHE